MEVIIDGVKYVPTPEIQTDKSLLAALEVRFDSDAGDNLTVRDYLYALLFDLWSEGEGFNSKRPFGNSGWEWDLYKPLYAAGYITGAELYEFDGGFKSIGDANEVVFKLISAMCYGVEE